MNASILYSFNPLWTPSAGLFSPDDHRGGGWRRCYGRGTEAGVRAAVGIGLGWYMRFFPPKDEMIGNVLQFGKSLDGGN